MKAVFLDRDGVVNEIIYHQEQGIIDSPFTKEQFGLISGVGEAIRKFREMDYAVVIVSNQPGIAKGKLSEETFDEIREKMKQDLAKDSAFLDGEYYCFHHPEAKVKKFKADCECRKPKPGMLLQAAEDLDIDLARSWMIGDNLTDIKAGIAAGTRTVLVGKMKCEICNLMDKEDARPDAIASNLVEVAQLIVKKEAKYGNLH